MNKNRIRLLSWILGMLILAGTLVGFEYQEQKSTQIKIGILQYVEHNALDAARKGFMDRMNESKYGEQIVWDIHNASGDQANLQSMTNMVVRNNDYLYGIATPAAQSLAMAESKKPIFFSAVTDPLSAGLVDSLDNPGKNVTGTSDMQPIEDQVTLLVNYFPSVRRVGILYNSGEINSKVQADEAEKYLEERGVEVDIATITSSNEIPSVLGSLLKQVDAMFMVTDNTIDNSIALVGDMVKDAGLPMVGSSEEVALENGMLTLSNSYYDYGVQTADMLIRLLDQDLKVNQLPVELGKDFKIIVNEDFCRSIHVDPEIFTKNFQK